MQHFKCVIVAVFLLGSITCFSSVKVASILKTTDNYSRFSIDILNSVLASVKVNPCKLKIEVQNFPHDGTPESLQNAISQAKNYEPAIILGGETSQFAMTIARAFKDKVFVSPTASSDLLQDVSKNVFRITQADNQYVDILDFIFSSYGAKGKKFGVFHNISLPNTNSISELSIKRLTSKFKVSPYVVKVVAGENLTKEKLNIFIKNKVDYLIFFSFENDLRKAYSVLAENDVFPVYIGADGWGRDSFLRDYLVDKNKKFQGLRVVYWDPTRNDSLFLETQTKLKKMLKSDIDFFHAVGFDSMKFIIDTLNKEQDVSKFKETALKMKYYGFLTTKEMSYSSDLVPQKSMSLQKINDGVISYIGSVK